ncbi:MAG: helix-turn-helix domain-containing protein, partial [Candidatus Nanopelagicales bacterium]
MTRDVELRRRIVQAAAELFTEHGYEGTRIRMVAQRADVTPRTVRRLTGSRAQLFAIVIAETVTSEAADQIARAAEAVDVTGPLPPLAAIIAAAGEV